MVGGHPGISTGILEETGSGRGRLHRAHAALVVVEVLVGAVRAVLSPAASWWRSLPHPSAKWAYGWGTQASWVREG